MILRRRKQDMILGLGLGLVELNYLLNTQHGDRYRNMDVTDVTIMACTERSTCTGIEPAAHLATD